MEQIVGKKYTPEEIPPLYHDDMQASKFYFGHARTTTGNISPTLAVYDFKKSKWRMLTAGALELLCYYEMPDVNEIEE